MFKACYPPKIETSWSLVLMPDCECRWQDGLRLDGRKCEDYRHMEIETDVVSNTDGSAKISLVSWIKLSYVLISYHVVRYSSPVFLCSCCVSQGHTDVLVGVKAEIGKPKPTVPDEGYLEFFVDWWVFKDHPVSRKRHQVSFITFNH